MSNKRGDMTIGTIIAIVLAVVVLVFLIYGFTTGWDNFMGTITNFNGGDINVDEIVVACNLACQQGSEYAYCTQKREVVFESGMEELSCAQLADSEKLSLSCSDIECDAGESKYLSPKEKAEVALTAAEDELVTAEDELVTAEEAVTAEDELVTTEDELVTTEDGVNIKATGAAEEAVTAAEEAVTAAEEAVTAAKEALDKLK